MKNFQRFVSSTCLSGYRSNIRQWRIIQSQCRQSLQREFVVRFVPTASQLPFSLAVCSSFVLLIPALLSPLFFTSGRASMLGKSLFVLCIFLVLFYFIHFFSDEHSTVRPRSGKNCQRARIFLLRFGQNKLVMQDSARLRLYLHEKEINSLCEKVWGWRRTIRWAEDGEQTSPVLN